MGVTKTFWDTNVLVYLFEKDSEFHKSALAEYERGRSRDELMVTSSLTLGELLVKPLRTGQIDLIEMYSSLVNIPDRLEVISFTPAAVHHYASIRATSRVTQPDAIQLACAAAAGVRTFVTSDRRLWNVRVTGIDEIRGL